MIASFPSSLAGFAQRLNPFATTPRAAAMPRLVQADRYVPPLTVTSGAGPSPTPSFHAREDGFIPPHLKKSEEPLNDVFDIAAASSWDGLESFLLAIPAALILPAFNTPGDFDTPWNILSYAGRYLLNGAAVFGYCLVSPFLSAIDTWDFAQARLRSDAERVELLRNPRAPDRQKCFALQIMLGGYITYLGPRTGSYETLDAPARAGLWDAAEALMRDGDGLFNYSGLVDARLGDMKRDAPEAFARYRERWPGIKKRDEEGKL